MNELRAPSHIALAGIIGQPIGYLWSSDVSDDILWATNEDYPSLAQAITPLPPRVGMALLAAAAEWVAWRYAGMLDVSDALARVEAGYAAAMAPTRVHMPMPKEPFPKENTKAYGPLKLARMLLSMGVEDLQRDEQSGDVLGRTFAAVLLARHVVPNADAFEHWLADVLRRAHEVAADPAAPPIDQPAIAPGFFQPGGKADEASPGTHAGPLVQAITPNPYLVPAAMPSQ